MPINVEHGGQIGSTPGQIIAQAGQANLDREQQQSQLSQQLQQQRAMQMLQIDAQADLQKQSADQAMARTAVQFGLQGKLQEQNFDQQVKILQEQSKQKAQEFDYEFSARDRQDMARYNNADQLVENSDDLTPEDKIEAHRVIAFTRAKIQPKAMPSKGYKWPTINGQQTGLGVQWKTEDGATVVGELDANGQPVHKLLQRWDQGPEAAKIELQKEQFKKQEENQFKTKSELAKNYTEFAKTQVEYTETLTNKEGVKDFINKKRFFNDSEIGVHMQRIGAIFGIQDNSGNDFQKQFDALPSGASFKGPDGKMRIKP